MASETKQPSLTGAGAFTSGWERPAPSAGAEVEEVEVGGYEFRGELLDIPEHGGRRWRWGRWDGQHYVGVGDAERAILSEVACLRRMLRAVEPLCTCGDPKFPAGCMKHDPEGTRARHAKLGIAHAAPSGETGMMAPGKDYITGQHRHEDREARWRKWPYERPCSAPSGDTAFVQCGAAHAGADDRRWRCVLHAHHAGDHEDFNEDRWPVVSSSAPSGSIGNADADQVSNPAPEVNQSAPSDETLPEWAYHGEPEVLTHAESSDLIFRLREVIQTQRAELARLQRDREEEQDALRESNAARGRVIEMLMAEGAPIDPEWARKALAAIRARSPASTPAGDQHG